MKTRWPRIAAVKRAAAIAVNITLWPYIRLATKINNATRSSIRSAIRRRNNVAYFIAVFWYPVLVLVIAVVIALFAEPRANQPPLLFAVARWLAALLLALHAYDRAEKVLWHHRKRKKRLDSE